ncbi:MAG: transcriptional repressor [Clostridia bacterium]|nr:transcriptional repressor [Clostridia bacterium]
MNSRGKYKTKQYDELLKYVRSIPGTHFTVGDIHNHMKEQGKSIGATTLYRHLDRMVDEGLVSKFNIDPRTPACYEYTGNEDNTGEEACYHMKCEVCGKLIHLHCEMIPELGEHLFQHHGFKIDPLRTVFYGICEDCREEE